MMQLFMWQLSGEDNIQIFCMTRLVMGNKHSETLSLVALRHTADLGDNASKFPVTQEAIKIDSYVDNVFRTAPDMKTLQADIEEIELVSAMRGFFYKDWIISRQDSSSVSSSHMPLRQIRIKPWVLTECAGGLPLHKT